MLRVFPRLLPRRPILSALLPGLLLIAAPPGRANAKDPHPKATPAPAAPRIEVAFVLDATGSMGPYIEQARKQIREIAAELATGEPKPQVRFALVAYRDRGDAFVTKVHPFSQDIELMGRALNETEADGGGDTPEAVLEGLHDAVTRLAWTPPADRQVIRLLYLIGDAPPQRRADGPQEAAVLAEARRRGISLQSIVCGSNAVAVEPAFERFARHTEGRVFRLGQGALAITATSSERNAASLSAALTSNTKAYSSSIGVRFGAAAQALSAEPLTSPPVGQTGLSGAHVRWIRDAASFRDLWTAHTSLTPQAERPALPVLDFEKQHVLVLGGSSGGLELEGVYVEAGRRAARVRPAPDKPGASFFVVAAAPTAEAN